MKVLDSQSGMKAFNLKALETLNLNRDGYAMSSETIILAAKHGLRIKEIPIKVIYTKYSKSKGTNVRTGLRIVKNLFLRLLFDE